MIPYAQPPIKFLARQDQTLASFVASGEYNVDQKTVISFGEEWSKFRTFATNEIEKIGSDYFDLINQDTSKWVVLDVGCGSGRWACYLAPKVRFVEAVDPSLAVWVANEALSFYKNTRVTHASVESLPFEDNTFDLVYSLGVLHHVPDTLSAVQQCFKKVKSGGFFLVYLYYALDNRSAGYRLLFKMSDVARHLISRLPSQLKRLICDLIAVLVYVPFVGLSWLISFFSTRLANHIPLSYYRKTSFFVMRNDALDRFGTPLEKRFTKIQIEVMLKEAGFVNISFSEREPYWHALAQKP